MRKRVARRQAEFDTGLLRSLLSSQSILAVGLDPEKQTFHVFIKTNGREIRKAVPLQPQHQFLLNVVRGMLAV